MDCGTISKDIARGDVESLLIHGAALKHLPANQIVDYLNTESAEGDGESAFIELESNPEKYVATALAYINIHLDLMDALDPVDCSKALFPFLLDRSQSLICASMTEGYPEILNSCAAVWNRFNSAHMDRYYILASDFSDSVKDVICQLELHDHIFDLLDEMETATITAFGTLLQSMGLLDNEEVRHSWATGAETTGVSEFTSRFENGCAETIDAYCAIVTPQSKDPIAAQILSNIEIARQAAATRTNLQLPEFK